MKRSILFYYMRTMFMCVCLEQLYISYDNLLNLYEN